MAAGGRPKKKIDWGEFDKLCALQATLEEIASWFTCSVDTIERAVEREKGMSFAEYFALKRGKGKVALRRKQYQVALEGNPTMLIWLGKQYLDQTDKKEITGKGGGPLQITTLTDEELLAKAREILNE